MVLGVTDTSQTGPSYSPLGTPLSSASCIVGNKRQHSLQLKPDKLHGASSFPLNNRMFFKIVLNVSCAIGLQYQHQTNILNTHPS